MHAFICTTCGTQYAPTNAPSEDCPICLDERQYVGVHGQAWTTPERLSRTHMNAWRREAGLLGIGTAPAFAIGQRALLVPSKAGLILWDCISLLDHATIALVQALGGLTAVAISHPHYYTSMVEWAQAFDVPVWLHADDREWVMRPDPRLRFWDGDTHVLAPGATLIRCGGHYPGAAVMHWADGGGGAGALLSGDTLQVVTDRKTLGFMRSYPNFVPLGAAAVRRIEQRLSSWQFDAIHGAFWDRVIPTGARAAFDRSVARHIEWCGKS